MDNNFNTLEKQTNNFPELPGVYLFKNSDKHILYVGKAKNLKKRIKSYFQSNTSIKNITLIEKSIKIDFIKTQSELEAMLLEAELIKANQPKFNILLKDGQPFLYIKITTPKKGIPKIEIVRNKKTKGIYYGPFLEKIPTRKVYNFLLKTFKLKICNKNIENGCLDYHLGLCSGSCKPNFDKDSYLERLELAQKALKKGHKNFLKYLEDEIKIQNKSLNFEKSKELYEYFKAFKTIFENLDENYSFNQPSKNLTTKDIWILDEDRKALLLFKEKNSSLSKKAIFTFPFKEKNHIEYLKSYYHNFNCSNTILTNFKIAKSYKNLFEKFLKKYHKKERAVEIINPTSGHFYNLIKLALINAKLYFEKQKSLPYSLKKLLKLTIEPQTIDCFDVSHKQGKFMVGSCVRFENGIPDKKNFRHFKIKTVHYSNDYACLQEIVKRRYKDVKQIPDLILIDGGKGQLNAIQKILPDAQVISLAKKEETIFSKQIPQGKILNINSYAAQLLISLRDYAHHFAINYHRKLSKIGNK